MFGTVLGERKSELAACVMAVVRLFAQVVILLLMIVCVDFL